MNNGPFDDRTNLDHFNTKQVRCSDPRCILNIHRPKYQILDDRYLDTGVYTIIFRHQNASLQIFFKNSSAKTAKILKKAIGLLAF